MNFRVWFALISAVNLTVNAGCFYALRTTELSWARSDSDDPRRISFHVVYGERSKVPLAAMVLRYVPGDSDEPNFTVDVVSFSEEFVTIRIEEVSIIPVELVLALLGGKIDEAYRYFFVVYVNGVHGEPVRIWIPETAVDEFFAHPDNMVGKPDRDSYGYPTIASMRRFWDTYVTPVRGAAPEEKSGSSRKLRAVSESWEDEFGIIRTRRPRTWRVE